PAQSGMLSGARGRGAARCAWVPPGAASDEGQMKLFLRVPFSYAWRVPRRSGMQEEPMSNARVLANQKKILANQGKLLANQGRILANQKKILANQKRILKKR